MKANKRTAVAAIGAAILNKHKVTSVFSYSDGNFVSIDAELVGNTVKCFDYSNSCFIEGDLPSGVYHFGDGSFIEFTVNSGKIDGYDYGSGSFFEIKVRGKEVEVYDFGDGGFHNFSVSM